MTDREAYVEKLKAKLDEWDAEIDKLEAKAKSVGADAEVKYHEQIAKLKEHRAEASSRLAELRSASGDAWQDIRDGAQRASDALGEALKSAWSKFHS
ncbi:sll1863 family stress response protein [Imhoffiella purpurea]|uniref:Putative conserved coiled coil protein n=1 Tax=Imhoffiella purpurea TaxID=1249627 RepID=W9V604_9GAMM|nr:hypothetical protein [Imhoffiella purpurea]EXJ14973.1 Putative conserved coiled coil protein [Imhoffiella purpurea]